MADHLEEMTVIDHYLLFEEVRERLLVTVLRGEM